ncbi:MAG TPA: CRISPR-associated RAMP protein Csx10 [Roseiflexaceae bacterium]|nr:CRISPR-associated RAMP protein Csx10 [Roseiflexaceae bacterium]
MIVKLNITALSPLAFPERKPGDQFRPSQPFVPGAVIYGALGERCYASERFAALRCHNAYPARQDDTWVHPLPATAIQPKGQEYAPVRDALVERVCWECQKPRALVYSPTDSQGRAWDRFDAAFYTLHDGQPGSLHTRTVEQRMLTRVAISRRSGTAADQQLYSPLVLNEVNSNDRDQPTMFLGSAVLPDGDKEALAALESITHLGGRQTSGLGRVRIEVDPSEPESAAALKERVFRLTKRFQEQAALYEQLGGDKWDIPDGTLFTINLLADTILTEHGWLPSYDLSPALLEELTGIQAEQLAAMVDPTVCAGWNVLWQRPKHSAPGLRKGGLFVFQAAHPLSDADCGRLAKLQTDGIGERRQEGYGQIRVCDTFHLRRDYERIRDR